MKLIKFADNWADEMDVKGFSVMTDRAWEYLISLITDENIGNSFTLGFGSNEWIEYDSAKDLLSNFTTTDITDEEAATLTKLFKLTYGYGHFPADQLIEGICEAIEEETGEDFEVPDWYWEESQLN